MALLALRKHLHQTTAVCALILISVGVVAPAYAGAPGSSAFNVPPNARPGECFARIMIPAQYETRHKEVVVDAGGENIQVSEARFGTQSQQIIIRDAGVRYDVRQPIYKAVHERVMVRPAYERLTVDQAQYRTVTEQVIVAPARTAWKPGKSLADWSGVKATKNNHGEVYCLVEIPPETKTVSKRVMVSPQNVRTITVPPVYKTITRHVLVDPGGVQEIPLPAQYANISTQRLVQRAGQHRVAYAPRTKNIPYRTVIAAERYEWIPVLCKTNATPSAISSVQTNLQQLGFYHGQLDGQLGLSTENAIRDYQHSVGIPHGGYLSLDTIGALREGRRTSTQAYAAAQVRASSTAYASAGHNQAYTPSPPISSYENRGDRVGGSYLGATELAGAPIAINQTVYPEGKIISRIPSGEVITDIQPELRTPTRQTTTITRRLTWAGKS